VLGRAHDLAAEALRLVDPAEVTVTTVVTGYRNQTQSPASRALTITVDAPVHLVTEVLPASGSGLARLAAGAAPVLTRTNSLSEPGARTVVPLTDRIADVQVRVPLPTSLRPRLEGRIGHWSADPAQAPAEAALIRRLAALAAVDDLRTTGPDRSVAVAPAGKAVPATLSPLLPGAVLPVATLTTAERAALASAAADLAGAVSDLVRETGRNVVAPSGSVGEHRLPAAVERLLAGVPAAVTTVTGSGPEGGRRQLLAALRDAVTGSATRLTLPWADRRTRAEAAGQLAAAWDQALTARESSGADGLPAVLAGELAQLRAANPARPGADPVRAVDGAVSDGSVSDGSSSDSSVSDGSSSDSSVSDGAVSDSSVSAQSPGTSASGRHSDRSRPEFSRPKSDLAALVASWRRLTLADAVPGVGVFTPLPAHLVQRIGVASLLMPTPGVSQEMSPAADGELLRRLATVAAIEGIQQGHRLSARDRRTLIAASADLREAVADQLRQAGRASDGAAPGGGALPRSAAALLAGLPEAVEAVTRAGLTTASEQTLLAALRESVTTVAARLALDSNGQWAQPRTAGELSRQWDDLQRSRPDVSPTELARVLGDTLADRAAQVRARPLRAAEDGIPAQASAPAQEMDPQTSAGVEGVVPQASAPAQEMVPEASAVVEDGVPAQASAPAQEM
ncbi:MAG TPA: hypothetical protein VFP72_15050, partial [Kineosporiaceae bacterium]|nr:hypothetical protein [Kineosporiaceae bacterium]